MVWQEEYCLKKQVVLNFKNNEALQCKNGGLKLKYHFPEWNSNYFHQIKEIALIIKI